MEVLGQSVDKPASRMLLSSGTGFVIGGAYAPFKMHSLLNEGISRKHSTNRSGFDAIPKK